MTVTATGINGPTICVAVGRTRHKMMQAEIQQAAKQGAKLIELRLDFLAKPPDFKRLLANKPCPMIATVRRTGDGGRFAGTEEERLVLLRQAIVAGFDWVDLETDIIDKIPRFGKVKRIVSYHNLREVPADLEEIYKHMCEQDADIVKLAVTAQHPSHNLRVFNLLKNPPKPTVAHCMGDLGICSRVLSAKFGAPFTYAAFNKERTDRSGHPVVCRAEEDLSTSNSINPATRGLRRHRRSGGPQPEPAAAQPRLAHHGINAVYLPFRVPRGDLGDVSQGLRAGAGAGLQRHAAAQGRSGPAGGLEGRGRGADGGGQHADPLAEHGLRAYNTDAAGGHRIAASPTGRCRTTARRCRSRRPSVLHPRRRRRRPGHRPSAAEAGRQPDHRQPHRRAGPETGRGSRLPLGRLGGPPQCPVRHPHQLHLRRHASQPGRIPRARQLPGRRACWSSTRSTRRKPRC